MSLRYILIVVLLMWAAHGDYKINALTERVDALTAIGVSA